MNRSEDIELIAPYSLTECQERLRQLHEKWGLAFTPLRVRTDVRLTPHDANVVEVTIKRIRRDWAFGFMPWVIFQGVLEAETPTATHLTGNTSLGWQIPVFWSAYILGGGMLTFVILATERGDNLLLGFLVIFIIFALFNLLFGIMEFYQKRKLIEILHNTFKG
jgi:hypothetical protein